MTNKTRKVTIRGKKYIVKLDKDGKIVLKVPEKPTNFGELLTQMNKSG